MKLYKSLIPLALSFAACQAPLPAPSGLEMSNAEVGAAIEQSQAEYLAGAFIADHSSDDGSREYGAVGRDFYVVRYDSDLNRRHQVAWALSVHADGDPAPSSSGWSGQGRGQWLFYFRDGQIVHVALDGKPYWSGN